MRRTGPPSVTPSGTPRMRTLDQDERSSAPRTRWPSLVNAESGAPRQFCQFPRSSRSSRPSRCSAVATSVRPSVRPLVRECGGVQARSPSLSPPKVGSLSLFFSPSTSLSLPFRSSAPQNHGEMHEVRDAKCVDTVRPIDAPQYVHRATAERHMRPRRECVSPTRQC